MKALGTGWSAGIAFRDIEVRTGPGGAPELELHGAALRRAREMGVCHVRVSLTHQSSSAATVVILEG